MAAAVAAAAVAAFLRPSTTNFFYTKYRPTPRCSPVCRFSLSSSAHQSLRVQPQLAIPNVVDILRERGLIESITGENLRSVCSDPISNPVKVYCGFDPTAESLHLGNLIGLIVLSWFRRCGHKTVALIGGATGRIGDPSGKTSERPELDLETIEKNSVEIKALVYKILHRANTEIQHSLSDEILNSDSKVSSNFCEILDNFDWWKDIKLLDFLREVGRYARVGTMMAKESVKKRLMSEEGTSYTEFSYQLLQGYDFMHMFKNMGVNVQIGGSDQWGNITAGTDLIRKILQPEDRKSVV